MMNTQTFTPPTLDQIAERLAKVQTETRHLILEFNRPYRCAVAVNCSHIGDDNDYSCFLFNCCFELWNAGKKEMAYRLFLTDPMLFPALDMNEFEQRMNDHVKFNKKQEEHQALYYRLYHD
jgi:hypothetical protein